MANAVTVEYPLFSPDASAGVIDASTVHSSTSSPSVSHTSITPLTQPNAEQSSMANAVTVEFHFFSPDASAGVIEASTVHTSTSNGH